MMERRVLLLLAFLLSIVFYVILARESSTESDLILDLCEISRFLPDTRLRKLRVHGISALTTCGTCHALLIPLRALAELGTDAFTKGLVQVCVTVGIQPADVCAGALGSQAPIIAHSLRQMSPNSATATLFCAKIFGLCPYPEVRSYPLHLPPPGPGRPVLHSSTGKKPFKVVHVTDIHVDRQYVVGSEADCGRTMCCRGEPGKGVKRPAGPFGDINCDAPLQLFNSMNRAINDVAPDADFMLFTGDVVDHAVWASNEKDVVEGVHVIYSLWRDSLKMAIYGTIGNHDVAPTNSFPRDTTATSMSSEWTLKAHAEVWRPFIGDQAARDAIERFSGCYAVTDPSTGVRIINLNTGFAYKSNFWLYDSDEWQPDPNGILAWLIAELQQAEDDGKRVWIIGHISSGKSDTFHEWSAYYNEIINRYNETIAAQMFGHSHRAETETTYSDYEQRSVQTASSITYIAPAMTPSSGNPAFRIYDVDPDTFAILDFTDFYSNMTAASYQHDPVWQPMYSAREAYGSLLRDPPLGPNDPLDAATWHRIVDAFQHNDTAFQDFIYRLSRGYKRRTCSKYCKDRWLRHLRSGSSEYNGDALELGLHIDAAQPQLPLHQVPVPRDAGFDYFQGSSSLRKRGRSEKLRVRAPEVPHDEEDPTAAGCSLHSADAGTLLQNLAASRLTWAQRTFVAMRRTRRRMRRRTLDLLYQ